MKEREYYHDVLQQTLLSGDALRQRLRADALDAEGRCRGKGAVAAARASHGWPVTPPPRWCCASARR